MGRRVFKLTGFFKVLVSLGRLSRKAATRIHTVGRMK